VKAKKEKTFEGLLQVIYALMHALIDNCVFECMRVLMSSQCTENEVWC